MAGLVFLGFLGAGDDDDDDDDELNINPPTPPCLGKSPQRPKPKGPGRPWGQKPLAHGRTVEGVAVYT